MGSPMHEQIILFLKWKIMVLKWKFIIHLVIFFSLINNIASIFYST